MSARETESRLIARCCTVARDSTQSALNQREANVFRLASMVIQSRFPAESDKLRATSEQYFAKYPGEKLELPEVVRKGWVIGLPRLRDRLSRQLGES